MESEAEIGSSDFHAGEIACGFIEQLPEKTKPIKRLFIFLGRENEDHRKVVKLIHHV